MPRQYYLDLAAQEIAMPIGADLVLKGEPDHHAILLDGARLGRVLEQAARRFRTPLAFPVMDLQLEKAVLLETLGVPVADVASFHFDAAPDAALVPVLRDKLRGGALTPRMRANNDAIRHIATQTDLVPVGMCIGPVSLMTKLIADPITPIFMAGAGETADENEEVKLVEVCLELAIAVILESLRHQIAAGARAVFIAEPAANKVFFSPRQFEADGGALFERYVFACNRRIAELLAEHEVDLLFHCCGELIDPMLDVFTRLRPALLSLGSSRDLVQDATRVPKDIVIYGNLPSKQFYSDTLLQPAQVEQRGRELLAAMRAAGHPFILGTECDTLSVPGCEGPIWNKVDAILRCACGPRPGPRVCVATS
jgi:hypothetical protein